MNFEGNGYVPWWIAVIIGIILSLPFRILWDLLFHRNKYGYFDTVRWAVKKREKNKT